MCSCNRLLPKTKKNWKTISQDHLKKMTSGILEAKYKQMRGDSKSQFSTKPLLLPGIQLSSLSLFQSGSHINSVTLTLCGKQKTRSQQRLK